jgi:hypothetical protein
MVYVVGGILDIDGDLVGGVLDTDGVLVFELVWILVIRRTADIVVMLLISV